MSGGPGLTPAEAARQLAAHLAHERRFRGLSYLPAGSTADADRAPTSPETGPGRPGEGVAQVQRRVLREQASQWPAARKLAYLRERNLGDCHRCALAAGRAQIVFGVGNPEAGLMFVGEAPGAEEDRRGEPFVGAAGRRLDQWIAAIGLRRDEVYIANVIKCRPPNNRDPRPEEIERCSPFLRAQIRAIRPRVLVALGRFAGALLTGRQLPMYQLRGNPHEYVEEEAGIRIPVVVTYHPSYVLRSEKAPADTPDNSRPCKSENDAALADLKTAAKLLGGAT